MKNDSQSGVASLKAPSMRGAIRVARAAAQQIIRLLAAVAAKIFLQQIDHGPEMAAFLDIDLEQIAQVVERGRGLAEMALLLDGSRLGVALDHDQAAQAWRGVRPGLPARPACHKFSPKGMTRFSSCGASKMPQRYSGILT